MALFPKEYYDELYKLIRDELVKLPQIPLNEYNFHTVDGIKGQQRTGKYKSCWRRPFVVHEGVEINGNGEVIFMCPKCGEPLHLHKGGECPVIIDGKFVEEPKPQLPSGEE